MRSCMRVLSLAAVVLLLGSVSYGQLPGIPSPPGGVHEPVVIKSPPLRDTDVWTVNLFKHYPNGATNWAGYRASVHNLDNTEVDVDAVFPGGLPAVTNPLGPRSENVQSVPVYITGIHPSWANTGTDLPASFQLPFGLSLHVKGSNPSGNSDIDVEVKIRDILHLGPSIHSSIFQLPASASLWVRSSIQNYNDLHIFNDPQWVSYFHLPYDPPSPFEPTAHWLKLPVTLPFHGSGGLGSQLIVWPFSSATFRLGIEHVPEPASAVLLGAGMVCAVLGFYRRRRRLAA